MAARRISPLAMILCLAAVTALGWAMVEMTERRPPGSSHSDLRTYDTASEPAPSRLPASPAEPPLSVEMSPTTIPSRSVPLAPGPDVGPTAAPGVVFSYRYSFRLPNERIAQVQEQHARACEQLGASRCRITGLRYRAAAGRIEAVLALKVEPAIARRVGRAGAEAVARAQGELIEAEILGDDAEATIRAASRGIAEMREDLQRLETRLAGRLAEAERGRLDDEARRLRQAIRAAEASRDERRESLASTPMLFHYASGAPAAAGARPEVGKAIERAGSLFLDGVSILFIIAVTLLPWALLAGLAWWLFRLARRRFGWHLPAGELSPA